jgi:hypothetical protein
MNNDTSNVEQSAQTAEFIRFADVVLIGNILPEGADAFALVVRGHILLEHGLIELLKHALPMADELKSRLSYQHRMELNIAAGLLPSDFRPFLEYVAELRNSFAHDLAFQLSIDNETEMLSRMM